MFIISGLYVYPVKSLGGMAVSSVEVVNSGFQYDRRWMLVDRQDKFITQRTVPGMAKLVAGILEDHLQISKKDDPASIIKLPIVPSVDSRRTVEIFDEICEAQDVGKIADQWLSEMLGTSCRLVYMPQNTKRPVDARYAHNGETTTFTDGYPFLLLGEASMADLNARLTEPMMMNRFRPNIVFTGGEPYQEDQIEQFNIGTVAFTGVKRCGRCQITTTNQETAVVGKEPLKTLAGFRSGNNKVYFGQYLLHKGSGTISTGQEFTGTSFKPVK